MRIAYDNILVLMLASTFLFTLLRIRLLLALRTCVVPIFILELWYSVILTLAYVLQLYICNIAPLFMLARCCKIFCPSTFFPRHRVLRMFYTCILGRLP